MKETTRSLIIDEFDKDPRFLQNPTEGRKQRHSPLTWKQFQERFYRIGRAQEQSRNFACEKVGFFSEFSKVIMTLL